MVSVYQKRITNSGYQRMTKYKTIMETGSGAFNESLQMAIQMKWIPMFPPTVNASTNVWVCILFKND